MNNILNDNFDLIDKNVDIKNIRKEIEREGIEASIANNNVSSEELIAAAAIKEGIESGNINFKNLKEEHQGVLAAGLASIVEGFVDFYMGNMEHEELHEKLNSTLVTVFSCVVGIGEMYLLKEYKMASLLISLGSSLAQKIISNQTGKLSQKLMNKINSKIKLNEKMI